MEAAAVCELGAWAEAVNGVGAPFIMEDAIWDQAVAASFIFPGSLANWEICSCQRSRYLFANASKSGGLEFSFVTQAFPGCFGDALLCYCA